MTFTDLDIKQYKLTNGLEVILYRNNSIPLVATNIWYRVGSANETVGKTGLAHLFEHMMFQGSQNVPKGMHFHHVQQAGGTLNASTSFDRTNYFQKVPAHFLELMFWLESDRMGFFLPALDQEKLQNQIDVVKNERLERYDNQPYGLAFERLLGLLYEESHPYASPVIGHMADIERYTLDDVKGFFSKHYVPGNASLVVAGDFEENHAREMIEKYFGPISSPAESEFSKNPIVTNGRKYNKYDAYEDNVELDRLYLVWHSVPSYHPDDTALEMLSDLLTGSKNGYLTKALTIDTELAQSVSSFQFSGKHDGFFVVQVTAKPDKDIEEIKKIVLQIIGDLKTGSIPERDLQRTKNIVTSGYMYRLQNLASIADFLNMYNFYLGTPNGFQIELDRYTAINESNIHKIVTTYFDDSLCELRVLRKNHGQ